MARAARIALLLLLAYWTWLFLAYPMPILFSPFGVFMTTLGGSLNQMLIPIICGIAFLKNGDRFGAAVMGWWTGQNLLDAASPTFFVLR